MNLSHVKYFRSARTYPDILGVRPLQRLGITALKRGLLAEKASAMS